MNSYHIFGSALVSGVRQQEREFRRKGSLLFQLHRMLLMLRGDVGRRILEIGVRIAFVVVPERKACRTAWSVIALVMMAFWRESPAEYGDIVINSKAEAMRKAQVGDVLFPHWFHRIRYRCDVCHEEIFLLGAGKNDMNMAAISEEGKQCGVCHNGLIAWEPLECDRCHSLEPGWSPGPIQHSFKDRREPKRSLKERALDVRIGNWLKPYSNVARLAAGWHPRALSESGLPLDRFGLVDWAEAVRLGVVDPVSSLAVKDFPVTREEHNTKILFRTRSEFVADVLFPHDIHVYWLGCKICHETAGGALFEKSVGGAGINMVGIREGKWCGRCHDRVAFPISDCARCHNHPKKKLIDKDIIVRDR